MSPRRIILRELVQTRDQSGSATYVRPESIPGFDQRPEKFQQAVNQLLKDRLIEGCKDDGGRMALAVNDHRLDEVRRAARPIWARPAVWAVAVVIIAAAGLGFMV